MDAEVGVTEGPRHSAAWYDQSREWDALEVGDRMLIPCVGGPAMSRLEHFPPRLEVAVAGGVYILDDDGARPTWPYRFIPA